MSDVASAAAAELEFAALAAIDWADQKHIWRLVPAGSAVVEKGGLENTPESVDQWATDLYERFGGGPVAVCLEQSRGPLLYTLAKYAHLVLFPVHPTMAANYRQTFSPSGAKDDGRDAASLLDLLRHHRDQLRRWQPDTVETRHLQFLVEQRRLMVDEKTRQSNRLTACLKMYFPQILRWFDDVSSPLVGDLLTRWPSLQELQRAHPGTLRKFLQQHNCRSEGRIQQRIQEIYQAVPATLDQAVLSGQATIAQGFLALLKTLRENIATLDEQIQKLAFAHPDYPIFASLPGAGPVMVPRLIVAFGTHRERFDTAFQIQCYSGIAPITEASGQSQWIHCRWRCPKFLRQSFHEYAFLSMRSSAWAKAYYQHQREDKKQHHPAAVRALAFKWIRILFRCWKERRPYDEKVYLRALDKHKSPLRGGATAFGWQQTAGFQKFSENPS